VGWVGRRPGWTGRRAAEGETPEPVPLGAVNRRDAEGTEKTGGAGAETGGPSIDAERAVMWRPVRCPNCGSRECPRYAGGEDKRVRYHRCAACGWNFKSIEE
jgi:predicted RNA-binding Zn-ribbon protein involved in translation (DUF1610 family)